MLRRKSSKAKKKPKARKEKKKTKSAASRGEGVVVQKPETDVYTVMLILSLLAICTACLLLFLELKTYGSFPQWRVPTF